MNKFKSISKDFFDLIGKITIGVGFLLAFIVAAVGGKVGYYDRNWGLTICLFLIIGWTGLFSGMLLIAIAEGLHGLEMICDNIAQLPNAVNTVPTGSQVNSNTTVSTGSYVPTNTSISNTTATVPVPPSFDIEQASAKLIIKNKTYENGPIIIRNAKLFSSDTGAAAIISMKNISTKTISAVKIIITTKDVMGSVIDKDFSHIIMDLSITPGQLLGEKEIIMLPSKDIRDIDISIEMIKFLDGTVWNREGTSMTDVEIKNEFVLADHEQALLALPNARAIFDYLKDLDIADDPRFNDELLPQMNDILEIERMYGSAKESAMRKIREIYSE